MKRNLLLTILIAAALVSCEKEPEKIDYSTYDLKITAQIDQTRSQISATEIGWSANDAITVVCDNQDYSFTTNESGTSANFTSNDGLTPGIIGENAVTAYHNCNMYGAFTIAQNQTVSDGVNLSKIPMYAYTAEAPVEAVLPMTFKPLCSVLEITIPAYDITINSIDIAPADNAEVTGALCGGFSVNAVNGAITTSAAINAIKVTFNDGKNNAQGTVVSIPVGWFTLNGGLQVTLTYNTNESYSDIIFANETVSSFGGTADAKTFKVSSAEIDIDLGPRAFYVKADGDTTRKGKSWASATTLDAALNNAVAGSTINIAAGIYTPSEFILGSDGTNNGHKTFELSKNITLVGGFAANAAEGAVADPATNVTILDGNQVCYHTVVVSAVPEADAKVVLNGLTIRGGNGSEATDQTVVSTVNAAELVDNYGGGLYVSGATVEVNNCKITENKSNGATGIYAADATLTINSSEITKNTPTGTCGGVWASASTLKMTDSSVSYNINLDAAGPCMGLYVYAAKEKSASAVIDNCKIIGNESKGNNAALYIRGGDATANVTAKVKNCEISSNKGAMGSGFGTTYATVEFDSCKIMNNTSSGNGGNLVYPGSVVSINNCVFSGNTATMASGIYAYTNADAVKLYVANSLFSNNASNGRGGAVYARAAAASVEASFANCTFSGNQSGSYGSAIALYGTAAFPVTVNLVSCTLTGNVSNHATYGGALGIETAGLTANLYNTIVSGNTGAGTDLFIKSGITPPTIKYNKSIVGTATYDAEGAVVAAAPAFTAATMFGSLTAAGRIALLGDSATNAALTYGMSSSELTTAGSTVSATYFPAAVVTKDQAGNTRSANIMGAYVGN